VKTPAHIPFVRAPVAGSLLREHDRKPEFHITAREVSRPAGQYRISRASFLRCSAASGIRWRRNRNHRWKLSHCKRGGKSICLDRPNHHEERKDQRSPREWLNWRTSFGSGLANVDFHELRGRIVGTYAALCGDLQWATIHLSVSSRLTTLSISHHARRVPGEKSKSPGHSGTP